MRAWHVTAVALLLVASAVQGQGKPGSVTITTTAPLSFGSLTGSAGGSVTNAPDGTRTAMGVFPVGGTFGPASFTVTMTQGNPHYMITLPANATLTSAAGATMTIDSFQSDPATQGRVQPPARTGSLTVGATLRVAPAQPPGSYSGMFQLMVNL